MTREEIWLKKRGGRPTSSMLKILCTGGRRDRTPAELKAASLLKDSRKTVDVEFGDSAITYLYQLKRERRRQKPTFNRDNKNFEWGRSQEGYAIAWLRANRPDWDIRHCNCEDDFPEIVFNIAECGLGDSPDFYVGNEVIGEIKCTVTESKFEQIMDMTKEEAVKEYDLQFTGHFIGEQKAERLVYLVYDGQNDDDPFDTLDPLDPSRGVIFEYSREEFKATIAEIEPKVTKVMKYLDLCDKGEAKVRDINNFEG